MRLNTKGILGRAVMASLVATMMGGGAYAAGEWARRFDEEPQRRCPMEAVVKPMEAVVKITLRDLVPGSERVVPETSYSFYKFSIADPGRGRTHIGFGTPIGTVVALALQAASGSATSIKKNGVDFGVGGWIVGFDPILNELLRELEAALGDTSREIKGFDIKNRPGFFPGVHDVNGLDPLSKLFYPSVLGAEIGPDGGIAFPKFFSEEAYDQRASAILRHLFYILTDGVKKDSVGDISLDAVQECMQRESISVALGRLKEVVDLITDGGWTRRSMETIRESLEAVEFDFDEA